MKSIRIRAALCLVVLTVGLAACGPPAARGLHNEARTDYDPLQPLNRKIFWFNDHVDQYVLAPVARGWDRIAPDVVERSVANFFVNIRSPIVILNDLLQAKPKNAASDVGRFAVNSTVGVVGLFDYATPLGLEQHSEDFGQTLGWWGLPAGPYLMIPLLGPSNVRDTAGMIGDSASAIAPWFVSWWILVPPRAAEAINARALLLEQVDEAKRASFDYYVFVRDAYLQHRNALMNDRTPGARSDGDDLYHPDLGPPGDVVPPYGGPRL
jgi:phospholipid-binding lipoprotein MlaA